VLELIDACLAGDEAAAAGIVQRFRGRVFGLCLRMVGHRQDAEDMAQETFARALKSLRRWDRKRPFEPWLLAIAANRCRTLLARRSRRPASTDLVDQVAEHRCDLSAARQLAEEVQRALDGLRADYREAFCLFHEQHLSYEQIAQTCDRPLGTVKTWIHRARREIADHLLARGLVEECETEKGKRDAMRPASTSHR
jgi:RNA polymerase sigma-70 factor (ECF subfamily)